jgi:hypothetical protein
VIKSAETVDGRRGPRRSRRERTKLALEVVRDGKTRTLSRLEGELAFAADPLRWVDERIARRVRASEQRCVSSRR